MLASEFSETCQLYSDFEIWEIKNIYSFFEGNQILATILNDHYGVTVDELIEERSNVKDTDLEIITKLLSLIGDKTFFIFTLHDKNHLELVKMQELKIMNFGLDINNVKADCVYVVLMNKKK